MYFLSIDGSQKIKGMARKCVKVDNKQSEKVLVLRVKKCPIPKGEGRGQIPKRDPLETKI